MSRVAVLVLILAPMTAADDKPAVFTPYTKPTLIAHRGASAYAPEHTRASYKLAIEQGADYVEPDLQMTRDGILVCLHDSSLERTTDVRTKFPNRAKEVNGRKTWPVAEFTWEEIKTLDAGIWKDAKFAGERVLTFQEMIDLVKGKAGLIPETKAPEGYGRLGLDMEKALMTTLANNGLDKPGGDPKTPVIIQSFSAESLKVLREAHGCKLPLVFLFSNGTHATPDGLKKVKDFADGIGPNKSVFAAHPDVVKDAHALNLSVTAWTVGTRDEKQHDAVRKEFHCLLKELKVDAVFTDNPNLFPRD